METRVKAGLESFLEEIGRYSRTSGFHYQVVTNRKVEIYHHNNKWLVRVSKREITVMTDEDILIIKRHVMYLNGEEINEICSTKRCYNAQEIVAKIVYAILLYHAHSHSTFSLVDTLYNWISG